MKSELELYKKLGVAPPRTHPTRRMTDRFTEMNIAVFEEALCGKCSKDLRVAKNVTYPERTIYCQTCYLAYMEARS
jgi:hypothetical protein